MSDLAERLLAWYDHSGRTHLPWQRAPTPYRVWVSEIMLQQTQVATVIPYYERFMTAFPDVCTLARAAPDAVLHHWSGLGYYARARNLHRAAAIVCDELGGRFPTALAAMMALPGIGRSTAGAILALAHGQRHAILDGNVKRVLARVHAVDGWPGQAAVARRLWTLSEQHTPRTRVAAYTQAIMDLGATVCTRRAPACGHCPLAADCEAHALQRETDFPGRKPGKVKPRKATCMLLVLYDGAVYLERRPPRGIWGGLWSLPEVAAETELAGWLDGTLQTTAAEVRHWSSLQHSFSHYDLDIQPVEVRIDAPSRTVADRDGCWYTLQDPPPLGLAAPVRKLLDALTNTECC